MTIENRMADDSQWDDEQGLRMTNRSYKDDDDYGDYLYEMERDERLIEQDRENDN